MPLSLMALHIKSVTIKKDKEVKDFILSFELRDCFWCMKEQVLQKVHGKFLNLRA